MRTHILRSNQEYQEFIDNYYCLTNLPVTLDYLNRAKVRGFFNQDGTMIGGYILNAMQPFRLLSYSFVSQEHRLSPRLPNLSHTVEGTCLWFSSDVDIKRRAFIYLVLSVDFYTCGKKFFLAGSFHAGIMRMHMLALRYPVYVIAFCEEDKGTSRKHYYYYGTKWTALAALPRWLLEKYRKKNKHPAYSCEN